MAVENAYDLNDGVRIPILIEDTAGVDTDPAALTFKIKTPAGVIITYTYGVDSQLVRDSAGNYHVDILGNAVGVWWWRSEAQNPYLAKEDKFLILPSEFD